LNKAIEFIAEDEMVEVTPKSLRCGRRFCSRSAAEAVEKGAGITARRREQTANPPRAM